jgi:hypothetical protein
LKIIKRFKEKDEFNEEVSTWLQETKCNVYTASFDDSKDANNQFSELENGNECLDRFVLVNEASVIAPSPEKKPKEMKKNSNNSDPLLDFEPSMDMIPFVMQKDNNVLDETNPILSTYRKITKSITKPKIQIMVHLFENVPTRSIYMPVAFEVLNQYGKTHWLFSIKAMTSIIQVWIKCKKLSASPFVKCMETFFLSDGNDVMIQDTKKNKQFPELRPALYSFLKNVPLTQEIIDSVKNIVAQFFKSTFESKEFRTIYRNEKIGNSTSETLLTPLTITDQPIAGNFFTEIIEASKTIDATIHQNLKEIFLEKERMAILNKMSVNNSVEGVLLFAEGDQKRKFDEI